MKKLEPETVVEILRQQGMDINIEQAKIILDFLHTLAEISITQYLSNENSRLIYQGKH